jgi:hypothetical protein
MRQGKNQVIVMGIDKLLLSLLYPLFFLSVLASRAVTITTTIVPMMDFLARVTTIKVSPQCGRTASPNGIEDAYLVVVAVLFNKSPLLVDDASNAVWICHDLLSFELGKAYQMDCSGGYPGALLHASK